MAITRDEVEQFFRRYAAAFASGLDGTVDLDTLRGLYAPQFIAAGPQGVMTGDNDAAFGEAMLQGYAEYRRIGTTAMTVTAIALHAIDPTHCLAHVSWNSTYDKDGRHIEIPFTNTYLLERTGSELKVFGWITGDEAQLLRDHGLT